VQPLFCIGIFKISTDTATMKGALTRSAVALLVTSVAAQFVPAPTDLIEKLGYANISVRYKEVPTGICEVSPQRNSKDGLRICACLLTGVKAGSQCQELFGLCGYRRRPTHLLVVLRGAKPGSL
jgi:hypothetical protein